MAGGVRFAWKSTVSALTATASAKPQDDLTSQNAQGLAKCAKRIYVLYIKRSRGEVVMSIDSSQQPMKLNFKDDTLTTVSRDALRALSKKFGFNETQTVLYALARLRDEIFVEQDREKLMSLIKA